jgi:transaldolase / glucose-6-phosphate isomerase
METGNGLSLELGKYQKRVDTRLKSFVENNFVKRLWNKDETLWNKDLKSPRDISLGWLTAADKTLEVLPEIENFCSEIKQEGFENIVLLGMGGSSLAPMVFQRTFQNPLPGGIKLLVLDTTEPEMIKRIESQINIATTLFIVSSKSGNTAEVVAFYEYFFYRVSTIKKERSGDNFIAITDEGSPLAQLANRKSFRRTFINFPEIGGRYSALSLFGMIPAALMGVNVKEFLMRTKEMIDACGPEVPATHNPGVVLGTAIAEMALKECDKLTCLLPPELSAFGLWLEQLLAESTGKNGKGILPFNFCPSNKITTFGKDRYFLRMGFYGEENDLQSMKPSDLLALKYPLINVFIKDELDLGKEFFRWEIATATAGSIMGVNPFDQPNVQESKKYTDRLLRKVEAEGELPRMEPALIEDDLIYYSGHKKQNAKKMFESFFSLLKANDFIALQAYLPEDDEVESSFCEIRQILQKNLKIAVSTQFGPRYLHSTGQYHKGGPNNGYFVQFVCNSTVDIQIPEHPYTFGILKRAQAIGDREALLKHKRKVIMIDLGEDYINGLNIFRKLVEDIQPPVQKVIKPVPLMLINKKFQRNETATEQEISKDVNAYEVENMILSKENMDNTPS